MLSWARPHANTATEGIRMATSPSAGSPTASARQNYRPSYLAYVDILGWKNVVDQIGGDFDRFDAIVGAFNALQSHEAEDERIRGLDSDVPVNLPPPPHVNWIAGGRRMAMSRLARE